MSPWLGLSSSAHRHPVSVRSDRRDAPLRVGSGARNDGEQKTGGGLRTRAARRGYRVFHRESRFNRQFHHRPPEIPHRRDVGASGESLRLTFTLGTSTLHVAEPLQNLLHLRQLPNVRFGRDVDDFTPLVSNEDSRAGDRLDAVLCNDAVSIAVTERSATCGQFRDIASGRL